MLAIGVDIGGTGIKAGLVDAEGNVMNRLEVPTPADSAEAVEDAVVKMINQLGADQPDIPVGVAAAGFINDRQSTVYYAPNIAWRNENMQFKLGQRVDRHVIIENDANAAGWAEFQFGEHDAAHLTMLTIGTGVGGAIIINEELFRGGFGVGAELGHLRVVPNGLECGCGQRGCLEQYGSGSALLRYIRDEKNDQSITAAQAKELLEAGDEHALHALTVLGEWLGVACASLAAVLDPQLFVIGGGVSVAGEALLEPIRQSFRANVSARGYHPEPEFATARLLNDAGIIGAADIARNSAAGFVLDLEQPR